MNGWHRSIPVGKTVHVLHLPNVLMDADTSTHWNSESGALETMCHAVPNNDAGPHGPPPLR